MLAACETNLFDLGCRVVYGENSVHYFHGARNVIASKWGGQLVWRPGPVHPEVRALVQAHAGFVELVHK
jgi:hypothetical protein